MSWADIEASAAVTRCRCDLRPGMSRDELVGLGGGCKMPGYGCPTLDKYRRAARPAAVEGDEAGWSPESTQVRRAK